MGAAESTELTETVQYKVKSQTGINRDRCERNSNCQRWSQDEFSNTTVETPQVC